MATHTPLQRKVDQLAEEAGFSGQPRVEAEAEMMRDVQKDRSAGAGPSKIHQGVAVGTVPAYRNATRNGRRGAEL